MHNKYIFPTTKLASKNGEWLVNVKKLLAIVAGYQKS